MIVYGELLFAENMIVGAVLLYITAQVHRISLATRCAKLKVLAGSVMCGAFSLIIFVSDSFPAHSKAPLMILMELCFALGVCAVAFGSNTLGACSGRPDAARYLRQAVTFVLVTYFMGGMIMGLLLLTKQQGIYTAAGIYTGDMKAGLLAIFMGLTLATSKQIIKTVRARKIINQHVYQVKLVIGDAKLETTAFVDTGNHLKDPIMGKPVAIASGEFWDAMQRAGLLACERFTAVPYTAVGSQGILEAVRLDYMEIMMCTGAESSQEPDLRHIDRCVVARSDGNFKLGSKSGEGSGCSLLIPAEIISS